MKQQGISLTELLVGLLLSSFIMLSLAQIYILCKNRLQTTKTELAESFDLQWVSMLLQESIRQAGFTPCLSLDQLTHYQEQLSPTLIIDKPPLQGIRIRRMAMHFNKVLEFQSPMQLTVSSHSPIPVHQPFIIADCYHAEINTPENVRRVGQVQQLTLEKPLNYDYIGSTYLGEWIDERWYMGNNPQKHQALYYQQKRAEELTPLIDHMQFKQYTEVKGDWIKIVFGLDKGGEREVIVGLRNA